jgi:hypothetical protein
MDGFVLENKGLDEDEEIVFSRKKKKKRNRKFMPSIQSDHIKLVRSGTQQPSIFHSVIV